MTVDERIDHIEAVAIAVLGERQFRGEGRLNAARAMRRVAAWNRRQLKKSRDDLERMKAALVEVMRLSRAQGRALSEIFDEARRGLGLERGLRDCSSRKRVYRRRPKGASR